MKKLVLSLAAVATISATTTITASAEEVVVNSGDTLWGISQDYDVSVEQLKELNNLTTNTIYPAQSLLINRNNETQEAQQTSTQSSDVYTIKPGDSLWRIGQKFNVSVNELKQWNNLSSNTIYSGNTLKVDGVNVATKEEATVASTQPSEPKTQTEQKEAKTITVESTAYTANCAGCSGITSTGINLLANPDRKVIAVDPDVIPLGTEVYVEGYGKAVAGDIGSAIQGNKIDVFIPNRSDALNWGRRTVEVTILD
ncbi:MULTISPECIES: LysM peptidoglycan-binding and 3D domain-containing protein [Pontibacillus]|uniref:LysM peptidoglycan-binding domain-containing protein n=1 Tax=Pontibacillus chungwhensis TaxID=265426 RepID=A0ABY8UYQ4_9BACI|nr:MULTISPECIES: 3D domain-containing protein [Pontibacillus]MCD5325264.1 LysM peptidoglycan-binding domain-containing protein [Pontibacillus sp. HN14]WIF97509.1 LysM peptidoglycan-binding domain-containing protein [Pontibacillus chungwhensis]